MANKFTKSIIFWVYSIAAFQHVNHTIKNLEEAKEREKRSKNIYKRNKNSSLKFPQEIRTKRLD